MAKALAALLCVSALAAASSASSTVIYDQNLPLNSSGAFDGIGVLPVPGDGRTIQLQLDWTNATLDQAFIMYESYTRYQYWEGEGLGNPPPYQTNERTDSRECNTYYGNCWNVTGNRAVALIQFPRDYQFPCENKAYGTYCYIDYDWSTFNVAYVKLTADGSGNAPTARLRIFEFAPAPEPSTWALMILGFGAAGTALRRRAALEAV